MIASLLDSVRKWKEEGERGGMCVVSDYCNGDECLVHAIVVIEIMSSSGEEETLTKDNKDLGMVKLRGQMM